MSQKKAIDLIGRLWRKNQADLEGNLPEKAK
jgi:hypothetical protein